MSGSEPQPSEPRLAAGHSRFDLLNAFVRVFLDSNLSVVFILLAAAMGIASLLITPREEDPQIVVPLADVYVSIPGHSAEEVEQLVATPLEKLLYQIDGVEYVYSMSREGEAIITVRYYVGEDRERSLVKLYKRIDEHIDIVPPGVTGWVVKPVEIDDVPIVTLTLTSAESDEYALRRVAEEIVERLAAVQDTSRAYVVGGQPRTVYVYVDPDRMQAFRVSPLEIRRAIVGANVTATAGEFNAADAVVRVEVGRAFQRSDELNELVVGTSGDRPILLKDVAEIRDGPAEATSYVRHGWGPASAVKAENGEVSHPAVTIAVAKKKGANAVTVARAVRSAADELRRTVIPDDVAVVTTRNYGLTADEKVNELIETLGVAVVIVIALLTVGLGWRESLIVGVAVPVVFGLTLTVNLLLGYTINRVTLFAMILSLGLLVDDPIVDVENISRHFALRKKATRSIVLEAVSEIRPPLITATLAVMVSFVPMFFITGMMGPYMRPMALNVPVAMLMSMLVAFTITPWLSYHVLRRRATKQDNDSSTVDRRLSIEVNAGDNSPNRQSTIDNRKSDSDPHDLTQVKQTRLYRFFYPLMAPLLHSRKAAWAFLIVMALATLGATALAATRRVPLKMLPFDNKNELLLVLDFDEGTTLERSDAGVRTFEEYLAEVPEVTDFTSYVGVASPIDFNGLVRHYYLRRGGNVAEIRVNLAPRKSRRQRSHAIGLQVRDDLTAIAAAHGALLKIVETPPGPPVLSTVVAEVYGRADHTYDRLIAAAKAVRGRIATEPGVVDVDDSVETDWRKRVFVVDKEKAALHGVTVRDIADAVTIGLAGESVGAVSAPQERNPLRIELRLPKAIRSSTDDLSRLHVKGVGSDLIPLAELGRWDTTVVDKTIYHKNLRRVVYVFAETAGRAPAEAVVDIQSDQELPIPVEGKETSGNGQLTMGNRQSAIPLVAPRPLPERTFLSSGGGIPWSVPEGIRVDFAGEGEWKITLDVFRDLGLAFATALVGIYILLAAQTGSFVIPIVVMLAIPLTALGIMPGFWLLNALAGGRVGVYADPIFFTATGMIGMIALTGIVTRDSIILVDFIHLSLARGRSLFDAIMESRVVRLRPILLTTATAMLSAAPIAFDPIFSGLAWSLIFGLFASTLLTLFVIPVTYWLLYARHPTHGLPPDMLAETTQTR